MGLRSNKETANDLAALQARTALQRRLPWRLRGTLCARALARAQKNWAVSPLQRPPTSAANTTSRVLPFSPVSSGYVSSFLFRAASSAAPSWLAALLLAAPFRLSGERRVVSTANCAPLQRVNPSATTSSLRLSRALKCARSMSLTSTFVVTRAPASRQTCAAAHSNGYPLFPKTPASLHTLRDGGQTYQVGGHIGRCVESREGGGGVADTEGDGMAARRSWLPLTWAKR